MSNVIYLDTYILQQDMRIRMPKSILSNINAEKGKTLLLYDFCIIEIAHRRGHLVRSIDLSFIGHEVKAGSD